MEEIKKMYKEFIRKEYIRIFGNKNTVRYTPKYKIGDKVPIKAMGRKGIELIIGFEEFNNQPAYKTEVTWKDTDRKSYYSTLCSYFDKLEISKDTKKRKVNHRNNKSQKKDKK